MIVDLAAVSFFFGWTALFVRVLFRVDRRYAVAREFREDSYLLRAGHGR